MLTYFFFFFRFLFFEGQFSFSEKTRNLVHFTQCGVKYVVKNVVNLLSLEIINYMGKVRLKNV